MTKVMEAFIWVVIYCLGFFRDYTPLKSKSGTKALEAVPPS